MVSEVWAGCEEREEEEDQQEGAAEVLSIYFQCERRRRRRRRKKKTKKKQKKHLKEVNDLKLDYAINDAIKKVRGKNIKAIRALLNMEEIKINKDGAIVGLNEQIHTLITDEATNFLFENENDIYNKEKFKGVQPVQSNVGNLPKVDLSKMSYSEYVKYLEENPNL